MTQLVAEQLADVANQLRQAGGKEMQIVASRVMSFLVGLLALASHAHAEDPQPTAAAPDPKANFHETGRIGLLGALTQDLWQGGVIFEHEYFEAQVLAHASFEGSKTRDVHFIGKAGARAPLGTLNYLAAGFEFGTHVGSKEDGVSVGGAFELGPYIALARYFAATPVMLNLWVNPVMYHHTLVPSGDGETESVNSWRLFQTGGFGIGYLFF